MKRFLLIISLFVSLIANARERINYNADWRLCIGDYPEAVQTDFDDSRWQRVTLPYAFNGDEAFRKDIVDLTDTICWYRKTFKAPLLSPEGEEASPRGGMKGAKYFIEFEGVRQGADFYLNGHHLGYSENGVMACGFDLTPYVKAGENVLAVRCDNSWTYRSRKHDSRYQWNDRNFNANYGGIPKNVWLHVTGKLYQTLPLYSDLGTTGTYIYATDFDIPNHKAVIHAESQVRNEDTKARTFKLRTFVIDTNELPLAVFDSPSMTLQPGQTTIAKAEQLVEGLHFWSWGYGYLYTVETYLVEKNEGEGMILTDKKGKTTKFPAYISSDRVVTRTGFRKTRFGEGKIWLNDRVLMVHGYAQRTSNEWPGVGLSVPAWLSDYSNGLMVESGANLVRWMHVTPWKQDIESCDRVGLIQAMPAGDAEKDVEGPRWAQRTELMRDAIIYNRNNPSILFYECGNESISREHMLEMKAIRDEYDPYGGRAIGSREMLDIDEAEYGGEMLYINKSKKHPMWAMEYCRDEGLRKYWDEWSYPYHKEGDGPLYRGNPAPDYNHNMDQFAVEMVRRWYDYWLERPGTGTRVSSGGVKIVFSDTNTHHRGESNFRMSGVVDAMRIPKDAFYAHQVMWSGWVEPEETKTYIIGHWNYPANTIKPIYVVSTGNEVELFLNGKSLGKGKQSYRYLYTFNQVAYEPGTLEAVADDGSRYKLETVGEPYQLKLTAIENPEGTKADGSDMVLFQVEVLDKENRRCPLDDRMIHFGLWGEGKWIGGIATRNNREMQRPDDNRPAGLLDAAATKNISDNYVGSYHLPVECGVNRVLVRTTPNAGEIHLSAYAEGVKPAYVEVISDGVISDKLMPQLTLKGRLDRGETPFIPSYTEQARGVDIISAKAGYDSDHASCSYDDNELSEWKNDGRLSTAWITYRLEEKAVVDDICLKLTGWRLRSYPLEVYAGKTLIWSGETERSLGYIHLKPTRRVKTDEITIRLKGAGKDKDAFGGITEVAQPAAGELDLFKAKNGGDTKSELRIVEIEFLTNAAQHKLNERPRILISTDIGGTDPDDNQSMIHLMMYSDLFQLEGLVSSPSFGNGSKEEILRMIDLYAKDYPKLKQHAKGLMSPKALKKLCKQGRHGLMPYKGYAEPTEGSEWIVKCARKKSDQPLWVLVWGTLEDVAQALYDAPDIVSKIRVYYIGGPNKKWGANSYAYIAKNFPDLWMIENNATYRGFITDNETGSPRQSGAGLAPGANNRYGTGYYDYAMKDRGTMGRDFIHYYNGIVKMGDTPSLLYMMHGDPNDPTGESWGGSFAPIRYSSRRVFHRQTTERDTIPVYSIVEWKFKGPVKSDISEDSVCLVATIDKQQWAGYYLGNGEYVLRYCPKAPAKLTYTIASQFAELNGLSGSFIVDDTWPGKPDSADYPLGKNWYSDRPERNLYEGKWQGAKKQRCWRQTILEDWAQRWAWL